MRLCIVVTIEGLGTNLLGCYGGAISRTPHLDAFASKAVVFDQCWLQSLELTDVLGSLIDGPNVRFQLLESDMMVTKQEMTPELFHLCKTYEAAGMPTRFFTDNKLLDEHPLLDQFTEATVVDLEFDDQSADALESTRIASLVQYAITSFLEQSVDDEEAPSGLLWIHSSGLNQLWDAPYELRTIPCDEEDPEPSRDTTAPNFSVTSDTDPDMLFNAICAASAQAAAIDFAWAYINELIEELDGQGIEPAVLLMGLGGYPMGEHVMVGHMEGPLYAERLHVPLIIRPHKLDLGCRVPYIVQPWQLPSLLEQAVASENESRFWEQSPQLPIQWAAGNRLAWAVREDELALITPAWTSRIALPRGVLEEPNDAVKREFDELHARWQVFVNPDDRWQQNDIADRVHDVVESLGFIAKRLQAALYSCDGQLDFEKLEVALESLMTPELINPIR